VGKRQKETEHAHTRARKKIFVEPITNALILEKLEFFFDSRSTNALEKGKKKKERIFFCDSCSTNAP